MVQPLTVGGLDVPCGPVAGDRRDPPRGPELDAPQHGLDVVQADLRCGGHGRCSGRGLGCHCRRGGWNGGPSHGDELLAVPHVPGLPDADQEHVRDERTELDRGVPLPVEHHPELQGVVRVVEHRSGLAVGVPAPPDHAVGEGHPERGIVQVEIRDLDSLDHGVQGSGHQDDGVLAGLHLDPRELLELRDQELHHVGAGEHCPRCRHLDGSKATGEPPGRTRAVPAAHLIPQQVRVLPVLDVPQSERVGHLQGL